MVRRGEAKLTLLSSNLESFRSCAAARPRLRNRNTNGDPRSLSPLFLSFIRLWRVTGEPPPCWGYTNLAIRLMFGHALFEIAAPVFGLRALGALVAQRVTHVPLRRQTHLTEQNHSTAKPYCTCMHVRTRQPRVAHSGPPQSVQTRPPLAASRAQLSIAKQVPHLQFERRLLRSCCP